MSNVTTLLEEFADRNKDSVRDGIDESVLGNEAQDDLPAVSGSKVPTILPTEETSDSLIGVYTQAFREALKSILPLETVQDYPVITEEEKREEQRDQEEELSLLESMKSGIGKVVDGITSLGAAAAVSGIGSGILAAAYLLNPEVFNTVLESALQLGVKGLETLAGILTPERLEGLENFLGSTMEFITNSISAVGGLISGDFMGAVEFLKDNTTGVAVALGLLAFKVGAVGSALVGISKLLLGAGKGLLRGGSKALAGAAAGAAGAARSGLGKSVLRKVPIIGTALGGLAIGSVALGEGTADEKTEVIAREGSGMAGAALGAKAGAALGAFGGPLGAAAGGVAGGLAGYIAGAEIGKKIGEFVVNSGGFKGFGESIAKAVSEIADGIGKKATDIKDRILGFWSDTQETMDGVKNSLNAKRESLVESLSASIEEPIQWLKNVMSDVLGIFPSISDLKDKFTNILPDWMTGNDDGLQGAMKGEPTPREEAEETFKSLFKGLRDRRGRDRTAIDFSTPEAEESIKALQEMYPTLTKQEIMEYASKRDFDGLEARALITQGAAQVVGEGSTNASETLIRHDSGVSETMRNIRENSPSSAMAAIDNRSSNTNNVSASQQTININASPQGSNLFGLSLSRSPSQ